MRLGHALNTCPREVMELRHLRYFIKAAELLHFTKAAESLFISQPALSVHIQQLEEELGTQLFARLGRNVRLTEAGELLLIRARQAVRELKSAEEDIDALSSVMRGHLSIAALPLFGSTYFPQWIAHFMDKHPEVKIKARSGASEDIETGLLSGAIDLGYSILPVEHPELTTKPLIDDELVVVFSENHLLAKRKFLDFGTLNGLKMALPSNRMSSSRGLLEYFARHSVQPNVVLEYDDGNALLNIVKGGCLVTCLPSFAVQHYSSLKFLPLPEEGQKITTAAIWIHLSPAAKEFLAVSKCALELKNEF
jgi:DNA-binding transcriptional LysR family regulator